MKKIFLPAIAIATLSFTSCGSSEAEIDAKLDEMMSEIESLNVEEILEEEPVAEVVTGSDYTSEECGYSITFPGTPSEQPIQEVPTAIGTVEMNTVMYEQSNTVAYMVAYTEYPSEYVSETDAESLLSGGKDGALESLSADIVTNEENVTLDGHPGMKFSGMSTSLGYYVEYYLILKENKLYQVAILEQGAYPEADKKAAFFDSFKLL